MGAGMGLQGKSAEGELLTPVLQMRVFTLDYILQLLQCPGSPSSTRTALGKHLEGSLSFKFILENFSYTENPATGHPLSKLSEEYASLKQVLHNNDACDPAVGDPQQLFLNCL